MAMTNKELFERALKTIPGGVNSPVRAFGAVGGIPRFFARGEGKLVVDTEGREYLDLVGSWGPLILGHAHPEVVAAASRAVARGSTFGAPTETEVLLAEEVVRHVPSIEQLRLVSSGTEATMTALRLARGATGRNKIIKFAGCYHGHADPFLVKAGSGVATLGIPGTPGITPGIVQDTLIAQYNEAGSVAEHFDRAGDSIAALIVEPVAGNMGVVPPHDGFLQALRELCSRHGALLIFDEVITGFRVALGGAQALYDVVPDLTCLGKVLGGGFPLAALGGRREIMGKLAPAGPVYQAGTLSGNPVATAAGLKTLEIIARPGFHQRLDALGERLAAGLDRAAAEAGIPHVVNAVGSMSTLFFTPKGTAEVGTWEQAAPSDTKLYSRFFHGMLDRGIYLAPAQFEATFVNAALDDPDIDFIIEAAADVLAHLGLND
jgi:glutamate-1-semialdehyde 2,1-aminomutase